MASLYPQGRCAYTDASRQADFKLRHYPAAGLEHGLELRFLDFLNVLSEVFFDLLEGLLMAPVAIDSACHNGLLHKVF